MVNAVPVFSDSDKLLYIVCFFNNITVQKNAEDALKIGGERFTNSNEVTSEMIWNWDISANEIFVGESYPVLFGHKLVGNSIS
jgi:hypothetical protein